MASETVGISINVEPVQIRIAGMTPKINAMIAAVIDYHAEESTRYMKEHAPWTDRTGNARNTLAGDPTHRGYTHQIILHGGMPYQIYLETRFAGKYSIIAKSVLPLGRRTMETLRALFEKL